MIFTSLPFFKGFKRADTVFFQSMGSFLLATKAISNKERIHSGSPKNNVKRFNRFVRKTRISSWMFRAPTNGIWKWRFRTVYRNLNKWTKKKDSKISKGKDNRFPTIYTNSMINKPILTTWNSTKLSKCRFLKNSWIPFKTAFTSNSVFLTGQSSTRRLNYQRLLRTCTILWNSNRIPIKLIGLF